MDGEGFLLLTDEDIGDMVKPLGARRKLITKRNILTCVSTPVTYTTYRIYVLFMSYSPNNLQPMCILQVYMIMI